MSSGVRLLLLIAISAAISACITAPPLAPQAWPARLSDLQAVASWHCEGRAAANLRGEGWQASLNWRQHRDESQLQLSGPLGIGALAITYSPTSFSVNGAAYNGAPEDFLRERLGFAPPLGQLRYWLLGVPAPNVPYESAQNADDRLQRLQQSGWTVDYTRYKIVGRDFLPDRLTITQGEAHAKIVVDRWDLLR